MILVNDPHGVKLNMPGNVTAYLIIYDIFEINVQLIFLIFESNNSISEGLDDVPICVA